MPTATLDGPEIDNIEAKRILVKEITDSLEKAYKLPREAFVVLIREHKPENVGLAGQLVIDRHKS